MDNLKRVAAFLCCFQSGALAQALPVTDIWIVEITEKSVGVPQRLVHTGRYNNQPMFSPDGKSLYFTMEREDGQTDVARVDIRNGETQIVLESSESEYSPTPLPGRAALSVVRVEEPDQRQRLWAIDLQTKDVKVLFESVEPVGYHAWLDTDSVAVFLLGETFDLHLAVRGSEQTTLLAGNIGRTLLRHPLSGELLYVDKNQEPWRIASIDVKNEKHAAILPLFPEVEDFAVDQQGHFWMGSGSKLYRSSEDHSKWVLMGDFSEFGLISVSRLAVDIRKSLLAIVGNYSIKEFPKN